MGMVWVGSFPKRGSWFLGVPGNSLHFFGGGGGVLVLNFGGLDPR